MRDAVFKARRHTPDLIVLDVMLPDGDGVEAIGAAAGRGAAREGADPVDGGQRPPRPPGVRERRERLRAQGRRGGRARQRDPRGRGGRALPAPGSRARGWCRRRSTSRSAPPPIRSPTASGRCCGSWRRGIPTRRSPPSSTSRCGPPRRTARTSCRSFGVHHAIRARPLRDRPGHARPRLGSGGSPERA